MEQTPYAPPAATVSDPVELLGPRPRSVRAAVLCLWISLAFGAAMSVIQLVPILRLFNVGGVGLPALAATLLTVALTLGLLAFVAVKLNAGRGWVRWLFVAIFLLGVALLAVGAAANPDRLLATPPLTAAGDILQLALQTAAVIFMFVRPSREWFAARRR